MTKLKLANGKTLTIADGCDLTETDEGYSVTAGVQLQPQVVPHYPNYPYPQAPFYPGISWGQTICGPNTAGNMTTTAKPGDGYTVFGTGENWSYTAGGGGCVDTGTCFTIDSHAINGGSGSYAIEGVSMESVTLQ